MAFITVVLTFLSFMVSWDFFQVMRLEAVGEAVIQSFMKSEIEDSIGRTCMLQLFDLVKNGTSIKVFCLQLYNGKKGKLQSYQIGFSPPN